MVGVFVGVVVAGLLVGVAGVVAGARVPIILTSRADSPRTRIASCAVAVLMARANPAHTEAA